MQQLTHMIPDFLFVFHWWALLFFLGLIVVPTTTLVFPNLFDKGYAFAKIFGILFVSYLVWILGSLKILPFTYINTWLIVVAITFLNFILLSFRWKTISKTIRQSWKIWLFEELLFFLTSTIWSFIRGFQPDIRGLEKFMDFGFVNAILRSVYFPPQDMWFSNNPINYYYFGHLATAVLTRLSNIPSSLTYNLMIATLFALCFTGAFSLGGNLYSLGVGKKKSIPLLLILGLLTAILLTLSSNLHPLYWLLTHGSFQGYWYPDATRFVVQQFGAIDNTIHEFPIYSFVVADLHGHLINLPFVLTFLALSISIARQGPSVFKAAIASWLLGIFYITNAWDLPIYSLVFPGVIFFYYLSKKSSLPQTIVKALAWTIPTVLGSFIFSLPFQLTFKNISQGVSLVDYHSPIWMLAVLWGLPAIMTLSFAVCLLKSSKSKEKPSSTNLFVGVLLLVSWLLIFLPEVIYIKDIYIHEYQRANTMFKFTYQSFVMFTLATPYILWQILSATPRKIRRFWARLFYIVPVVSLLIIAISYSYFAAKSYYLGNTYYGLDGTKWLQKTYPGEFHAAKWLNNLPDQPAVLQAAGDSYTDYDVISSYTGLPTVQGWLVHEWLWRGSYDEPGKRATDVETLYTSANPKTTRSLLEKYAIKYVVVGNLEKQKYPKLNDKFANFGTVVFSSNNTKIYKINL
ncbi:MAG: hypothetical protein A2782_04510 [Candidatus Blackburnbacteria bacterium RIFCSPHIGHO2_01_FULL_43_15b]|uniref:YYY membrane protein n=1 Tax=Candidatus Blackburnbacteria bacterium RIFCSPHIGHO2_01_FULL_43_15b TaxID=1797513 RepID=A0A1G1V3K2_9BACT|nr:MAG: hypothetical protein A2782_04510 [Candidatus Blackburnbacteria bacterium RIFCSPHIGHO2_01_FULL_43_15b]